MKALLKILVSLVFMMTCMNTASGQDPTLPNAKLLERLKGEPIATAQPEKRQASQIRLRALVLSSPDSGVAILEFDGQRIRLHLNRQAIFPTVGSSVATSEVQIAGTTFRVEDFSDRSIVLFDGQRRVLVQ